MGEILHTYIPTYIPIQGLHGAVATAMGGLATKLVAEVARLQDEGGSSLS